MQPRESTTASSGPIRRPPRPSTAHVPVAWAEKGILTSGCPSFSAVHCARSATFLRGAHDPPTGPRPRDCRRCDRTRRRPAGRALGRARRLLPRRSHQRHGAVARRPHHRFRPHLHRGGREPAPQRDLDGACRRLRPAPAPDQPGAVVFRPALESRRTAPRLHVATRRRRARRTGDRCRLVPADGRTGRRSLPHPGCRRHPDLQPGQQVDRVHQGRAAGDVAAGAGPHAIRDRRPTNVSRAASTTG